ncbi:MAG: MBL fold metallo-hydrolase, partial [bacterium]
LEKEYEFEVIYTPGHSPGSISFYWPKEELLVSGDVIFSGGIGRTDLPGGNMAVLKQTVAEKIFTLPEETRICPGHGPETTVQKEKQTNPYV